MNINSYLNNILTKQNAEDVVEAFIGAVDALNTDGLVDITPEKAIVSTTVIGKTIRRCIARILRLLSQYTPNRKVVIYSQDEYDNLIDVDEDVLYVIRRDDRCFAVTLDESGNFDPLKESVYAFDNTWWDTFARQLKTLDEANNGTRTLEMFVGKDFNVDAVLDNQFKDTKLQIVTIDLPNYTVGSFSFANCTALELVRLGSGVTTIADNAFSGCKDLQIRIDKAQGSVLGAPWGAQNATVIWSS